jgi:hypothetical protein
MEKRFHNCAAPNPDIGEGRLFRQSTNKAERLNTCFVCGGRLLANEEESLLSNLRVLRHRNCSKQRLVLELRKRAATLGLTSVDLLTRRVAELKDEILRALGEVSFEQFQTAEPVGYLQLLLCGSDLKVKVVFSHYVQSEAIYLEALMTPGELEQQKSRLLIRIEEETAARPASMRTVNNLSVGADWRIVADWLKHAEDHWNGRKKEEIACEVIATERVQYKILYSAGKDLELVLPPSVPDSSKLRAIAEQILAGEDPESTGLATIIKTDLVEVI